jgi:phosphoserine phosphatase
MPQSLLDQLLAMPPGNAIFDMDGTLIRRDVGEAALRRVLHQLPPKARAAIGEERPWEVYEQICKEDYCKAGDIAALALAGQTESSLKNMVYDAFTTGEIAFHSDVVALAQGIARHHKVWILTGSAEILGRVVGEKIGIVDVVGMRLKQSNGVFQEELIPPCTCGQGKVAAAQALIDSSPVFSIGDSPTDLPLLRIAKLARTLGKISGREFPAFTAI